MQLLLRLHVPFGPQEHRQILEGLATAVGPGAPGEQLVVVSPVGARASQPHLSEGGIPASPSPKSDEASKS